MPLTLRAAVTLVAVEAAIEIVVVGARSELTVGLRVGLMACVALKWVFAWRAASLHPGGAFGLLMLEGTTVLAALGATTVEPLARLALGGAGLSAMVLVLASLHAFPSPDLSRPPT